MGRANFATCVYWSDGLAQTMKAELASRLKHKEYQLDVPLLKDEQVLLSFIVCYYIIITIVQSYTGKYHEFVAVCIVTSAQHE